VVPAVFWATDACTSWGMGGFMNGEVFSVSWDTLRAMKQKAFYPFSSVATSHINYLELFAVYWALLQWGHMFVGCAIPILIDNTATIGMLKKLSGEPAFLPLINQIFLLLLKYNIRLLPAYISTFDNILADALSRGALAAFRAALEVWSLRSSLDKDREDWKLSVWAFEWLDLRFGPFSVSACCDDFGANSHTIHFWSPSKSCLSQNWARFCTYCNPPFSLALTIIIHFLKCKLASPLGTSAVFILPHWDDFRALALVRAMPSTFRLVRLWPAGTEHLFTAQSIPQEGTLGRKDCGPTQWDVGAYFVSPTPISEPLPGWVADLCSAAASQP
jgi:hypothetical protein